MRNQRFQMRRKKKLNQTHLCLTTKNLMTIPRIIKEWRLIRIMSEHWMKQRSLISNELKRYERNFLKSPFLCLEVIKDQHFFIIKKAIFELKKIFLIKYLLLIKLEFKESNTISNLSKTSCGLLKNDCLSTFVRMCLKSLSLNMNRWDNFSNI